MSQHQKTPLSRTFPLLIDAYIHKQLQKLGHALPCQVQSIDPTGTIVTVAFQLADVQMPQVTIPVVGAEYIRYPIQQGCLGGCLPFDVYMGQITGLGTGVANSRQRANLSALVFVPMGNANWSDTDDPNAVVVYGPNGVILRDSGKKTTLTLTPNGVDINAQHQVTVEADTKVQATVGSNSVLLNTTEILATVGSNSVLVNATEIVLTIGAATFTMTAAGIISTVPITAPTLTGSTAVVAGTSLTVAGKQMSGHIHAVPGVTAGGATVNSNPPT